MLAARSAHWFPSVTKQGVSAIFQTSGNDACHVILRGGKRTGSELRRDTRRRCVGAARQPGTAERVMVDCSHGNSEKDHRRQPARGGVDLRTGSRQDPGRIFGVMLESHLVEGRQDYVPGRPAVYGQSITDACISLDQTEPLLEQLAHAQQARGAQVSR